MAAFYFFGNRPSYQGDALLAQSVRNPPNDILSFCRRCGYSAGSSGRFLSLGHCRRGFIPSNRRAFAEGGRGHPIMSTEGIRKMADIAESTGYGRPTDAFLPFQKAACLLEPEDRDIPHGADTGNLFEAAAEVRLIVSKPAAQCVQGQRFGIMGFDILEDLPETCVRQTGGRLVEQTAVIQHAEQLIHPADRIQRRSPMSGI